MYSYLYGQYTDLTLEKLEENKICLFEFDKISETDIMNMYAKCNEKKFSEEELKDLKYNFDHPLFVKLIFRKRNESDSVYFYNGLDPGNKRIILAKYKINCHNIFDFLTFLKIKIWSTNTIITKYFDLNKEEQQGYLDTYNGKMRKLANIHSNKYITN